MSDKFYCNDESRINELSLEPGGVTLTVTTRDGKSISYDKVKNHWAYARKVLKLQGDSVVSIMLGQTCLLYTSPSPRDRQKSRMPSSA